MKANITIREMSKNRGVFLWEIADALGMHDSLFSKKLRKELPRKETEEVLSIIDRLSREKQEDI